MADITDSMWAQWGRIWAYCFAETIVIGWMGSSAAFQTPTLQSLYLEIFDVFSFFNLGPGWEKLLTLLTRQDHKVL